MLCQDHRGKESNECPLNQKPPEVESCCHFRWRITNWKPVIISFLPSSYRVLLQRLFWPTRDFRCPVYCPERVVHTSSHPLLTAFQLNICIFVFVFRFAFFVFFPLPPPHQSLSTQCNVTCGGGDGYRTGERVCMRLFPKSADNPHPVKTGRKVDAKNCAHVKIPPAKKLVRKCKPCQFRWEVSPWSKVGCSLY